MNKSIGYLYTQVPQLNAVKTGVWRITMYIIRDFKKFVVFTLLLTLHDLINLSY